MVVTSRDGMKNLLNQDQDTIETKQTQTVFGSDSTAEAPAQGAQNQCFSGDLVGSVDLKNKGQCIEPEQR